ncbi:hypothetical protein ABKV19_012935 [Rosa sericea]
MDGDEFINLLHGSDPVKVELNRLENEVRDKDRELGEVQAQIKAHKLSERAREKAVEAFIFTIFCYTDFPSSFGPWRIGTEELGEERGREREDPKRKKENLSRVF